MKLKHRHYKALQKVCTEAYIKGKKHFLYTVPVELVFPKEWPKGIVVEQTDKVIKYRFLVRDVLNCLYELGRSDYDAKMLLSMIHSVEMSIKMILHHSEEVNSNEHKRRNK